MVQHLANQVVISFLKDNRISQNNDNALHTVVDHINTDIFAGQHLSDLRLRRFSQESSSADHTQVSREQPGVYVFPSHAENQSLVVAFLNIEQINPRSTTADAQSTGNTKLEDQTPRVLQAIRNSQRQGFYQAFRFTVEEHSLIVLPQELTTHGGPATIPVPPNDACSASSGGWKFSTDIWSAHASITTTGNDVTVFVLDTLPAVSQIQEIASSAGNRNLLLQSMVTGLIDVTSSVNPVSSATPPAIKVNHKGLGSTLENLQIADGIRNYPMPDHGLFLAGIIRDLSQDAKIECVRILNDYGIGNAETLIAALNEISIRMQEGGDLYHQSVIINLSMVLAETNSSFEVVSSVLQCLAAQGAFFTTAAGNEGASVSHGPDYPAALSASMNAVLSVGAVKSDGQKASYSNYPGAQGIATYGGNTIDVAPAASPNIVTVTGPTDAVHGVYCSTTFPGLLSDSSATQYPEYNPSSNNYGWACWSGTSFATGVISGIAARVWSHSPGETNTTLRARIVASADTATLWDTGVPQNPVITVQQHCLQ